jgi:protein-disulfide isomerase
MNLRRMAQAAAVAVAAFMLSGQTARSNWDATVATTELGWRVGNPQAKVKLVEFFSYTCPHCAEFARESDGALKIAYLAPGRASLEYRHLVRDPIDLTVGLLVSCGPVAKYRANHDAFLLGQNRWIAPLARPTGAQVARWRTEGAVGRRYVATDFKFYELMAQRGYRRAEVDQCLADDAKARRVATISAAEWDRPGVDSTPTFAINNVVMPGTHTWASLEAQIKEFL